MRQGKGSFSLKDSVTRLVSMGTADQPHGLGMMLCVSLLLCVVPYCYSQQKGQKLMEKSPSLSATLIHWTKLCLSAGNPVKTKLYIRFPSNFLLIPTCFSPPNHHL